MKRIIVQFQFKSDYQTGILTLREMYSIRLKWDYTIIIKLSQWLIGFFPQVLFINIYFVREWAGSGGKVKNEATPQKINKILYASICIQLGMHTLDKERVTQSRKICMAQGQVKQN